MDLPDHSYRFSYFPLLTLLLLPQKKMRQEGQQFVINNEQNQQRVIEAQAVANGRLRELLTEAVEINEQQKQTIAMYEKTDELQKENMSLLEQLLAAREEQLKETKKLLEIERVCRVHIQQKLKDLQLAVNSFLSSFFLKVDSFS